MNRLFKGQVIENIPLTENVYLISIKAPFRLEAKPGQFFIIRVNQRLDPLLGRPFSIFDLEEETVKFLYRVKGKGTKILSKSAKGEELKLTGPLGRWYPFPKDEFIVIAGGIGIASVFYLIKKFPNRAYLFYGAREKNEIFFNEELKNLSKKTFISTECGFMDYKGLVTEVFKEYGLHLNLPIYACGPMVMLGELKKLLTDRPLPCYVAVEERMACGIGACLGCAIETKDGYRRVCTDGPVFPIGDLKL